MGETTEAAQPGRPGVVRRHNLVTRLWHWVNAGIFLVMLMSGLCIFNAHPRLYWGAYGANPDPAWLEITAAEEIGYLRIGKSQFETTGVLGVSASAQGKMQERAFPGWATLPANGDLAAARRWHLTFAWLMVPPLVIYALWSLVCGHLRRDLLPRWRDLHARNLWHTCRDHAMLRFPRGAAAARYNPVQKLTYLFVVVGLIPLMVLSGLAMAPAFDAVVPWVVDAFGGRQSARSVHFVCAALLVAFVVVHVAMVLLCGPLNHTRSMITGWLRLPPERPR